MTAEELAKELDKAVEWADAIHAINWDKPDDRDVTHLLESAAALLRKQEREIARLKEALVRITNCDQLWSDPADIARAALGEVSE